MLGGLPNRWVVQDGDSGYYDGLSGAELHWQDGAFTPTGGVSAAFTARPEPAQDEVGCQLALSFRTREPVDGDLLLGGALETAWRHLTGGVPAGWGSAEPAGLTWSRQELTDFVRERAPQATWTVAVGGGGRPSLATHRTSVTDTGVEEDVTLTLGFASDEEPPYDTLTDLARQLVAGYGLVSMLIQCRPARADLTVPSQLEAPPTPIAFVLGSEDARSIGVSHARRPPLPERPVQLGTLADAGFYYPLLTPDPGSGWAASEELVAHLRSSDPGRRA